MSTNLPDRDEIRKLSKQLAELVTDPRFKEAVAELQSLPPNQRQKGFDRIASVDALKARGLKLPNGLRTSPRYFEDPETGAALPGDPG